MYGAGRPKIRELRRRNKFTFSSAKIIERTEDTNGSIYRFNRGYKPGLSAEVITFVI